MPRVRCGAVWDGAVRAQPVWVGGWTSPESAACFRVCACVPLSRVFVYVVSGRSDQQYADTQTHMKQAHTLVTR